VDDVFTLLTKDAVSVINRGGHVSRFIDTTFVIIIAYFRMRCIGNLTSQPPLNRIGEGELNQVQPG
jgi:hypothetical protein